VAAAIKLLRCGRVLAPEPLGARDLVVAGGQIAAVAEPEVEIIGLDVEVLALRGLTVTPGFIDNQVQVLGAVAGSASRAACWSCRPAS
jgi:beta-aspartyl-dipeptidase (metallo-type)